MYERVQNFRVIYDFRSGRMYDLQEIKMDVQFCDKSKMQNHNKAIYDDHKNDNGIRK